MVRHILRDFSMVDEVSGRLLFFDNDIFNELFNLKMNIITIRKGSSH